jgi:hypothetical protein
LFGCKVKLVNAFCWFSGINAKSGGSSGSFLRKNALGFTHSSESLRIGGQSLLLVPGYTVVASP